jgi:Leucine rich repeat variant
MSNPIKPFDAADLRKLLATASNRFTELNDDGWIPAFSEMELKDIILRGDASLRMQIAGSRSTPAETLNQLARDSDSDVRRDVARNPNMPAETLNQLARDSDSDVRCAVAKNPNTPAETLNQLARDSTLHVSQTVAENPNTPKPKESCFIATAATGSYDHPITATLRGFRDEALEQTVIGRWFVEKYYQISPPFARWIAQRPAARFTIKWVVLYPLVQLIRFFS